MRTLFKSRNVSNSRSSHLSKRSRTITLGSRNGHLYITIRIHGIILLVRICKIHFRIVSSKIIQILFCIYKISSLGRNLLTILINSGNIDKRNHLTCSLHSSADHISEIPSVDKFTIFRIYFNASTSVITDSHTSRKYNILVAYNRNDFCIVFRTTAKHKSKGRCT